MIAAIRRWYCREFHEASLLSRPVCGHYTCFVCLERYAVPWEQKEPVVDVADEFPAMLGEGRVPVREER